MKLSSPQRPRESHQPFLFEEMLTGHGHVRTVVGDAVEELSVLYLNGERHRTDSRADYCPDISRKVGRRRQYFECKGVGRSRTPFIYAGRLAKDKRLVAHGYDLSYVIWHHGARTKLFSTVTELRQGLLTNMRALYIIPFSAIAEVCSHLKEEKLNSAYGHAVDNRKTYGSGFRLNLSLLSSFVVETFEQGLTDNVMAPWLMRQWS